MKLPEIQRRILEILIEGELNMYRLREQYTEVYSPINSSSFLQSLRELRGEHLLSSRPAMGGQAYEITSLGRKTLLSQ